MTSATKVRIEELGDVPPDVLSRCHVNGLHTAQDLLDEGAQGCRQIGLGEEVIIAMGEMLDKHGFNRLD